MKEIGKLIELLNEYDGDVLEYGFVDGDIRRKVKNFDNERNTWKSVVWYTKQFGFIKWLVENDKIDTSKANDKNLNGYEIELRIRAVKELVADSEEKTVLYLNLLMLLSISDEPIQFLISILK